VGRTLLSDQSSLPAWLYVSNHAELLRGGVLADNSSVERPRGVTTIAVIFVLSSLYLFILGLVRFVNPDAVSLSLGSPLLHGLQLAGPWMFLLAAGVGSIVGFGLLRLWNLARRAAIVIALAGMVMLIPKVSAAATDLSPQFFVTGSMIVVRMMIVWYLWQGWTAEKFR
jgi:hypothetical protein